jgi:type IV pilus biogenesis protein PilP
MPNDCISLPPWVLAITLLLTPLPGTAYAQAPGGTIGELQDIQTATVLAKARASLAEITKKLGGPGSVVDPNASGLPAVQLIAGNARSLAATLIYPSGATYEARTGEDVPGGYRVQSITTDAVVLNRAGQIIKLGFSGSAAIEPVVERGVRPFQQ